MDDRVTVYIVLQVNEIGARVANILQTEQLAKELCRRENQAAWQDGSCDHYYHQECSLTPGLLDHIKREM
jgi:hypothetical protein